MYGNDGGLDVSWDGGDTWESPRLRAAALPYHVSADMRRPYWVCTGLQDNGSWCGPSSTRSGGIHMWNWISVGGGDGFQTADRSDRSEHLLHRVARTARITRYDLNTGQTPGVRPQAGGGGRGGGGGGGAWRWRRRRWWSGGGGGRGNVPIGPGRRLAAGVELEHADPAVAAQPEHGAVRRHAAVHLARPRHHVDDERAARQEDRSGDARRCSEKPHSLPSCGNDAGRRRASCRRTTATSRTNTAPIVEIAESPVTPRHLLGRHERRQRCR